MDADSFLKPQQRITYKDPSGRLHEGIVKDVYPQRGFAVVELDGYGGMRTIRPEWVVDETIGES